MKKIGIMKILGRQPLFTFNEFVRITGKSSEYARTYLYRLRKEGLIFQVERGKYTVFDDPLVFASHITVPSYMSFWTAFRFYDFTEQLPRDVMIAMPKSKKSIEFQGTRIKFFKMRYMWGYKKQRYRNFDIFVAEKEKSIIDSLLLKNVPFDEIAKAIETKDFEATRLVEYAKKTENKALMKRVGYLMEKFGFRVVGGLEKKLDDNYILLDWNGAKNKGKKDRKWKIIVNRNVENLE